ARHLDGAPVLTTGGRGGRVVSLTAARVRVDFNPAFAGRKVRATFKIVEKILEPAAQVKALVDLTYGRAKEFHVEVHGGTVTLRIPDRAKFDFAWIASKPRLIERGRSHLKPEKIVVNEEYTTPAKKEKEPAAGAKAAPAEAPIAEKPPDASAPHKH